MKKSPGPSSAVNIAALLAAAGFLVSCTKAYPPPPPPQQLGAEVASYLEKTRADLVVLRLSSEVSESLFVEAEALLKEAKVLSDAGQPGQAYAIILKARALIQGAQASLALGKSGRPAGEAKKTLDVIQAQARSPIKPIKVRVTRAEAERALGAVRARLERLRVENAAVRAQWRRAESLLSRARTDLNRERYDAALHGAGRVDAVIGWMTEGFTLPAVYGEAELREWRVRERDTLWDIAGNPKVYGDPVLWPVLHGANKNLTQYPDYLKEGWVIRIPADAFQAATGEKPETSPAPRERLVSRQKITPLKAVVIPAPRPEPAIPPAGGEEEATLEIELEASAPSPRGQASDVDEIEEILDGTADSPEPSPGPENAGSQPPTLGNELEGLPE